mmetsp:Transcript_35222/g.81173  ORF Transcript_35222/g.81173 Transcript_35222/m.81173 type:complete len:317 (+) Transcript_35222:88-1038(+)
MTKVQCAVALLAWSLARSQEVAESWIEEDDASCILQAARSRSLTAINTVSESDYVPLLIDRFLESPLPLPNNNLTSENPLVFLHQERAAGMSLKKLMSNSSQNLGLAAHFATPGQAKVEGPAAVYGGNFCWKDVHRSLREKGAKQVSCLTNFREPVPRIMSCYSDRVVGVMHAAPACMGDLSVDSLKKALVNHGCIDEPFKRFGECEDDSTISLIDVKGRGATWQSTLDDMSQCVPIILGRQVSLKVAASYFPQMADAVWDMKNLALNRNTHYLNQGECQIPDAHFQAIKELAEPETMLYEAAVKRMWQLMLSPKL